jgi:hypothetical protein
VKISVYILIYVNVSWSVFIAAIRSAARWLTPPLLVILDCVDRQRNEDSITTIDCFSSPLIGSIPPKTRRRTHTRTRRCTSAAPHGRHRCSTQPIPYHFHISVSLSVSTLFGSLSLSAIAISLPLLFLSPSLLSSQSIALDRVC